MVMLGNNGVLRGCLRILVVVMMLRRVWWLVCSVGPALDQVGLEGLYLSLNVFETLENAVIVVSWWWLLLLLLTLC